MSERVLPVMEVGTIQEEDEEEEVEVNCIDGGENFIPVSDFTKSGDLLLEVTKQILHKKWTAEIDEGSDTDLELEEEKPEFDVTGKITYLNVCRQLSLVPVSYFLRHMTDKHLSMAHHGLGSQGIKALSYPLMKNTFILSLDLQDNWLEGEGGEYIARMLLENCYISELNLASNRLGTKGCAAVCRALQTNVTLKTLDMSGNDLTDADTGYIAEAFYENNRLKTVSLSHNNFGHTSSDILAEGISENETIEHIDLSWNHFRLKSATVICDGIATNSRLRVVNLAMNGLGNEGAFGVAEILKQSGTVTSIDISRNRIGPVGAIVIGKALETNDLLKTLKIGYNPLGQEGVKTVFKGVCPDASCVVHLDFSGIEVDKEFRTMKEELQQNRNITIEHGPVLSDYVIVVKPKNKSTQFFGQPLSEVTTDNIMATIKSYCDENGLSVYDNMLNYDKNKERKLSRTDFLSAFSDVAIELSTTDVETFDNLLTDYRTPDGKIDFSALK